MDQVLKDERYNIRGIFFNPHHAGLDMGPESKIMGSLVRLSIDVFEGTESEGSPITINSFYNIPHIVSRDLVFIAKELDESLAVAFEEHRLEATVNSKSHSMIHRISLSKQRIVVAWNLPSGRSSYHSGGVATGNS
jgi:hypothetical protein